eukprot:14441351-Alexandrium_andersonii.AAC.1
MPPAQRTGRPWSFWQTLPPAARCSVTQHEEFVAKEGVHRSTRPDLCFLTNQRPSSPAAPHVPALLRKTMVWSMRCRQGMLPC